MKGIWCALSLVIVLVFLVGCGPQPTPTPSPTPKPTTVTSPTPAASPSPTVTAKPSPSPTVAAGPKTGGTLRYWINVAPAGWDPQRKLFYSPYFVSPIFNTLMRFDVTKTGLGPENIQGDLAEKWTISPDGLTYTFNLYPGVKWHDGSPFTADDVVYSIQKMMDPQRSALPLSLPAFKGVERVDDLTVRITLSQPTPSLLAQLCQEYCVIQSRKTANVDYKSTDFLMGTGPFKFKNWTSGVIFEAVRNPDYFRKPYPYLDGFSINLIADRTAAADALITGKVDLTNPSYGITSIEILQRLQQQAPNNVYQWVPYPNGSPLYFNFNYAPLKNKDVRKALAMVTDPRLAVIAGFGDARFRDDTHAIFAASWGITQAEKNKILGWDKPMPERIAAAQKLMADAGYGNGFTLRMAVQNVPENVRYLTAIADSYRVNLKINTVLQPLDAAQVVPIVQAGDFDAYVGNLPSMVGDPDEASINFITGNAANVARYSNPKVDQMFDQQSHEVDVAKRRAIVQDIERILLDDVVCIPDGLSSMCEGWAPYVKGFVPSGSPYGSHLQMERVWLDK